jgi:hypothetical protein
MIKPIFILLLLLSIRCNSQEDFTLYYIDGRLKIVSRSTNGDTIVHCSFNFIGQPRDTMWFLDLSEKPLPIKTSKRYYKNGQLAEYHLNDPTPDQKVTYFEKRQYYSNGKLKLRSVKRGIDTIEYKDYNRGGKIRDSIWLYLGGRQEVLLGGTRRLYYNNGQVNDIVQYGKTPKEYTLVQYNENGTLKKIIRRPTGVSQYFYGKRNKMKKESDIHKGKLIYVPHTYRKRKHFSTTAYAARVTSNGAWLVYKHTRKKIKPGRWMSIQLKGDTNWLRHCVVEGFSKDSVYFTKLNYNPAFKIKSGEQIMKYDSTFAVGLGQLNAIYYSLHDTRARRYGAKLALVGGIGLIASSPFASAFFITDGLSGVKPAINAVGITAGIGISLVFIKKHLEESAVPKMYSMDQWKIVPCD